MQIPEGETVRGRVGTVGYMGTYPLLVTFYQKICFCEYKNCIGPGLVTRHVMGRRKVMICIRRC